MVLPLLGAAVLAEQRAELFLSCLLLDGELGDLLNQRIELLLAMLLMGLLLLDRLLAFLLLGQLVTLMAQLFKALADLLVQLHEGGCRLGAQTFQGVCR